MTSAIQWAPVPNDNGNDDGPPLSIASVPARSPALAPKSAAEPLSQTLAEKDAYIAALEAKLKALEAAGVKTS
jgi:hypothetical protein